MSQSPPDLFEEVCRYVRQSSLWPRSAPCWMGRADDDAARQCRVPRQQNDVAFRHDPPAMNRRIVRGQGLGAGRRAAGNPPAADGAESKRPSPLAGSSGWSTRRPSCRGVSSRNSPGPRSWARRPAEARRTAIRPFPPLLAKTFKLKRQQAEALGYPNGPTTPSWTIMSRRS